MRLTVCCSLPIVIDGLKEAVASHKIELTVVDQLEDIASVPADVVLIDADQGLRELWKLCELRLSVKRALQESRVVLWVRDIAIGPAMDALDKGVRGILRKSLPVDLQVKCLLQVQKGEVWIEKDLASRCLTEPQYHLTHREVQLVELLMQGFKNKEIANTLYISEGTVKVYLSRLFIRLGITDRFDLAMWGAKHLASCRRGKRAPVSTSTFLREVRV